MSLSTASWLLRTANLPAFRLVSSFVPTASNQLCTLHDWFCRRVPYIVINGDEPLIDPEVIRAIIPAEKPTEEMYVANLMTVIKKPSEVVDFTNIKVVTDSESNALFMSRSPIPYPKAYIDYDYYKHVGVLIYTKSALKFFVETPKGFNEKVEDVNELRFIEHGIKLKMIEVEANSLSVDTPKDLEHVKEVINKALKNGEII